jgi:hypothetical protein
VLQEKHRLGVLESGVQREVFGCKEKGVTGNWRKLIGSFIVFTPEQILLG